MGYPLVKKIIGRTSDLFYLPSGDIVPGISLIRVAVGFSDVIRQMQIIQDSLIVFRVRFVPGPNFSESGLKRFRGRLMERLSHDIHLVFERVEQIEREKSGKTRFCISRVKTGQTELSRKGVVAGC